MPGLGPKSYCCVVCKKRTKDGFDRRWLKNQQKHVDYMRDELKIEIDTDNDDYVACSKCFMKIYRKIPKLNINNGDNNNNVQVDHIDEEPLNDDDNRNKDPDYVPQPKKSKGNESSPKNIALPIFSTGKSHSSCCVCKKRGAKLVVIPAEVRYRLFIEKECLLLAGSRCCSCHFVDNYFTQATLNDIKIMTKSPTDFNRTDLMNLINYVRTIALKNEQSRIDFDGDNLTDADYLSLTGITKANFDDICSHVTTIRNNKNRSSRTCIALLLVKLRSGMSNKLLSTLFNIGKSSVRRALTSARKELSLNFTPRYIGFNHITREEIINHHTRPLAQELFGNIVDQPAILILDGTYVYIQKSNNFSFQRRTYSMHKNRPLVKPMIIVSSTGYIISILGPYLADHKNNDAGILKHNLKCNMESMNDWIQPGDVMIVDRGFRDATDVLEDLGVRTEMPKFLPKGQKQFTCEEANTSRMVTKIRWVVESVNGRLKQWKYLQNIVPNNQIPDIGENVKLIGAICNKYKPPLSSGNQENDQILAAKIKVRYFTVVLLTYSGSCIIRTTQKPETCATENINDKKTCKEGLGVHLAMAIILEN